VENASFTMSGEQVELFDVFTDTGLDDFQDGTYDNTSFTMGNLILSETDEKWTTHPNWAQTSRQNISIDNGVAYLETTGSPGWSPDSMITNNGAIIYNESDMDSVDMALDGNNTIHVGYLDGSTKPHYSNSDDNGNDWLAPQLLKDDQLCNFIKVFVGPNNHVHIFFDIAADGGSTTYYLRSTDGGETFSEKSLWADAGMVAPYIPCVAWDADGTMHVVATNITGSIPPFPQDVMYFNSTDDGLTFNTAVRVDDDTEQYDNARNHPQIAADSNGLLHIVWLDGRVTGMPGENDIFYSNSSDHQTFSANRKIDNATTGAYHLTPRIAVDGDDKVHVMWTDNRSSGRFDVLYTNSTDGGVSFQQDHVVNDDQTGNSTHPDMVIDTNDELHVTWQDWDGANEYDVYYTTSDDSGASFDSSERIDKSDTGNQTLPAIDVATDDYPHFVWKDNRMISTQIFHTHLFDPHLFNGEIQGIADLGIFPKYFDVSTKADLPDWTLLTVNIRTSPDQSRWSI